MMVILLMANVFGVMIYAFVTANGRTWRQKFRATFRPPMEWVDPDYQAERLAMRCKNQRFENNNMQWACQRNNQWGPANCY